MSTLYCHYCTAAFQGENFLRNAIDHFEQQHQPAVTRYYTLSEVAEITGMPEDTIRQRIRTGTLAATADTMSWQWLIAERDLDMLREKERTR